MRRVAVDLLRSPVEAARWLWRAAKDVAIVRAWAAALAAAAAAGLVGLVAAVVVTQSATAQDALAARQDVAERATRRIDRIANELAEANRLNTRLAETQGQLAADVAALREQVRQLCEGRPDCQPVAPTPTTSRPRSTPSTTAKPRRPGAGTTTTAPGRTTTTVRRQGEPAPPPSTTTTTACAVDNPLNGCLVD